MSALEGTVAHLGAAGIIGGGVFVACACAAILAYGRARDARAADTIATGPRLALLGALWVGPMLLGVGLFLLGFRGYVQAAVAPSDALPIELSHDDSGWHFDYGAGVQVADALRLPAERPVRLALRAGRTPLSLSFRDLPFRIDAAPASDGTTWFVPPGAGEPLVWCLGCETGAPRVLVQPAEAFDRWRDEADGGSLPPAEYGRKLYARSQCQTCHSLDGSAGTGPSFKGLFGRMETLADGSQRRVDAEYVRESILEPGKQVVQGYQPLMPPFAGQLNDKQIAALVAFIESNQP